MQDTGLDQEANDAAARVAGVGGDREDRYTGSSDSRLCHPTVSSCVVILVPMAWLSCTMRVLAVLLLPPR